MIKVCSLFCEADVIKFQKRDNKTLLSENEYNSPHPNPENSYGDSYGKHREFLEFDIEQHKKKLKKNVLNIKKYTQHQFGMKSLLQK